MLEFVDGLLKLHLAALEQGLHRRLLVCSRDRFVADGSSRFVVDRLQVDLVETLWARVLQV